MVPVKMVVDVGSLKSVQDVDNFLRQLSLRESLERAKWERASLQSKLSNQRTDVRGGGR